jgi:hypothetical protein
MGTRTRAYAFLAALAASGSACSSPETLSGPGGSCLMATDCQLGFVCYENACTSNLTPLVNIEDVDAPYDAPEQVQASDAAVATPPSAEGSLPPSQTESGAPPEAGASTFDATQPPVEASSPSPTPEASPPHEASPPSPPPEAGMGPDDAAAALQEAAPSSD